jgi:Rod binding domain-containing protein
MNVTAVGLNTAGYDHKPESIKEAAEAFEALLVGQLLKSAREARGSDGWDEADSSSNPLMELSDEQMANQISKGGGCGLARALMDQIDRPSSPGTTNQKRHSIGSRSSTSF